ncbi:MAG TPA: hypothetical protein VND70_04860 [Acidimicrobiales bacterium]|nr:hypothetical protein [Acidimicrobiales bacterium]
MNRSPRKAFLWSVLGPLALTASACAGPFRGAAPITTTVPPTTTTTEAPTTTVPVQPGWTPIATGPNGVITDQRNVTVPTGRVMTVVRFRAGQILFNLHIGSQDPPVGKVILGPESLSYVSMPEVSNLLAAFNGGFKVNAAAGGVQVDGQVLAPLTTGFASFVIDANGSGRLGVWGSTVPVPGEQVSSVRQNLIPLIVGGQISSQIGNLSQWGSTLHGVAAPARSALGEDAAGNILYAGSASALPIDLATALSDDGATVAMQLDINPEWVQCDVATTPGGALAAAVPGQNRGPNQYLVGWTRDFVTVLNAAVAPSTAPG